MITEQDGKSFARGVFHEVAKIALWWIALSIFITALANWSGYGTDSTDKSGWQRSGLRIHKDALTGIEYLSDGKGGLVRREFR